MPRGHSAFGVKCCELVPGPGHQVDKGPEEVRLVGVPVRKLLAAGSSALVCWGGWAGKHGGVIAMKMLGF